MSRAFSTAGGGTMLARSLDAEGDRAGRSGFIAAGRAERQIEP